jgi:gamma-glutamyl:cysteine ligase YbdK (ATP-grasp superfamily)
MPAFGLFERFGVELEYMIVDARTLRVRPWADRLIRRASGSVDDGVLRGSWAWSNELVLHVIELKTARPVRRLEGLADGFQAEVGHINGLLAAEGAMLLPTAMHPWMDPRRDSRLWPHECGEIYRAFDRIFDCGGHGWTNLQSAHLNLPFDGDAEFARLHTAIRLLLPLLPALAASSPFMEGRRGGYLDQRLEAYRRNCARVPSVTGEVVPERVGTEAAYRRRILQRIYRDMASHDPEGVLRHEWANARGAIARFERRTIEIRVLDLQECPAADLAILQAIVAVLRRWVNGEGVSLAMQGRPATAELSSLFRRTVRVGRRARVESPAILRAMGLSVRERWNVGQVWRQLLAEAGTEGALWRPWVDRILEQGCLAERMVRACGPEPGLRRIREVYRDLAGCLARGEAYEVGR